jgi:phosphoglycerol geranylgeranyltransferase
MKGLQQGKVEKYINEKIQSDGGILSIIIDPMDYPLPEKAVEAGIKSAKAGADLIAVGGSIGSQGKLLDTVTRQIKEKIEVPIVLFPGNIATITPFADAIYFMYMVNSRNPYWHSQAQTLAAPLVRRLGVEPLPVGYIMVEPGGTAGWVGDANLVPRDKPKIAASLALAAQYMGARIIFTDAGSAVPEPIPREMVQMVSQAINVPYLVAGGIRTPGQAGDIIKAGADWVQIGTSIERSGNIQKSVQSLVKAIKYAGKKKL